jgi:hypothetical protein
MMTSSKALAKPAPGGGKHRVVGVTKPTDEVIAVDVVVVFEVTDDRFGVGAAPSPC